jgi:tRNA (Thr-GGU) A37 N-methylase
MIAHGVLATRSPRRPNPIGLSLVELTAMAPEVLHGEIGRE